MFLGKVVGFPYSIQVKTLRGLYAGKRWTVRDRVYTIAVIKNKYCIACRNYCRDRIINIEFIKNSCYNIICYKRSGCVVNENFACIVNNRKYPVRNAFLPRISACDNSWYFCISVFFDDIFCKLYVFRVAYKNNFINVYMVVKCFKRIFK